MCRAYNLEIMPIHKNTMRFLIDLESNNNRDWFNENKSLYITAIADFTAYLDDLIVEMTGFDESLSGVKAKDCVFRIYRDVRFSKDKSPYKPHFSAYISGGGRKSNLPGYYFHLDPFQSFIAGGKYMPEAEELLAIRTKISNDFTGFQKIINEPKFKANFGEVSRDFSLKTAPKGFPKDHEALELLKLKSFTVSRKCSEKEIKNLEFVADSFRTMKPLLDFLNDSLKM